MARIAGVDLPRTKRVEIGLTYIYGIGRVRSNKILKDAGVSSDIRVKDLSEDDVRKISRVIEEQGGVEGDLRAKDPRTRSLGRRHAHLRGESAVRVELAFGRGDDVALGPRHREAHGAASRWSRPALPVVLPEERLRVDRVPEVVLRERSLPTQNIGKQQGRHDGRVALDDELRSGFAQLAPGDLFVRHRTGVGSVACRRIRDLAEIRP